jgi:hypothetical protein
VEEECPCLDKGRNGHEDNHCDGAVLLPVSDVHKKKKKTFVAKGMEQQKS